MGGKLGTFSRDGFTFDTGPSLLTLPAVYRDLFLKTGEPLEDNVDLVAGRPGLPLPLRRRHRLDVPNASRARIRAALDDALGAGAGADWTAFLDRAQAIWHVTRGPFLESPLDGPARPRCGWPGGLGDVRTVAPWRTLRGLGRRHLRDPRLRSCSTATPPTPAPTRAGRPPRWPSCPTSSRPSAPGRRGRPAAAGEAVHERALRRGRDRAAPAPTSPRVLVEGGRAAGVRLAGGEQVAADLVVADADAAHLYRDLVPARRPPARGGCAGPRRPCPASSCCWRCAAGRPGLAHHTVLFPDDYDDEFDAVFGPAGAPGRSTTRRSTSARPTTRRCAPTGHEAWFVLVNAPRHGRRAAGAWTGTRPGSPRVRRPGAGRAGRARARRARPAAAGARSARRPTWSARHRAPAARSTARPPTAPGPPSCARPTAPRCRACSWSAGRRTRAADCRWSALSAAIVADLIGPA